MPDAPLVSVIIPAYNRASTIGRAINSVLGQTLQDFEIIVTDDGSTDDTVTVIRGFHDNRIQLFVHDNNLGPAAARNTSVRNARGTYLALLDSDDEWMPLKLEKQVKAMRSSPPGVFACTTGILMIQGENQTIQFPEPITPLRKKLLWGCDFGPGTTLFVLRSVYNEIGFMDETLPRCQDWDWLIRYSTKHELLVLPEVLVKVFRNTRPSPDKIEIGNLRIIEKHREEYILFGARFEKKALARRWREVAWAYYDLKRDLPKERLYFWRAICADPWQPIGLYVAMLDSLLGTNIKKTGSRVKAWLLRK